ncbi:hypothetical protein FWK35_00004403 [Aphis craccivora]|nr:hypothetical protein FWK35_00004403 [Aphis craccivora]
MLQFQTLGVVSDS